MEEIIGKLTAEHVKLTQLAGEILAINGEALAMSATAAHKTLIAFSATLQNHIALEDKSLYPACVGHKDPAVREAAQRFLASRKDLESNYLRFRDEWSTASKIQADPRRFRQEVKLQFMSLAQRMFEEDEQFHPLIVKAFQR